MLDYLPSHSSFECMRCLGVGQELNRRLADKPKVKIRVLHGGKRIALVKPSDAYEKFPTDRKVTRPKIAPLLIGGRNIPKANCISFRTDPPFKHAALRGKCSSVLVYRNQIRIGPTIVVKENEKLPARIRHATVAVCRRTTARALNHSHLMKFGAKFHFGFRCLAIISYHDHAFGMLIHIGSN